MIYSVIQRKVAAESRKGFTLVEVLVVMIILATMGGMVVAAVQGVSRTARERGTKSIIAAIDAVIQEHYESYKYRPLPVEIPDLFRPTGATTSSGEVEIGFDALASEAARVRLMMIRDLQRMELPDRLSDVYGATSTSPTLRAAVSPVLADNSVTGNGNIIRSRDRPDERRMLTVSWYTGGDNVPARVAAYVDRMPPSPTVENQGAECLYLIMSTSFVAGTPAINSIPNANIGDTDGDGLNEILDGWGQPLEFIRWPVGYLDSEGLINTNNPDEFDLFKVDYAYVAAATTNALARDVNYDSTAPLPTHPTEFARPWSIKPLIFSVGDDGVSGITTVPWTSSGPVTGFSYQSSSWDWPVSAAYYGDELGGRDRGLSTTYSQHAFPDPYLRKFVADNTMSGTFNGRLPGELVDSTSAIVDRADNITNYQLQADQ